MAEFKQLESFRAGMCRPTSLAVDVLKEGKPGDTKTREELAAIIGRNVEHGSLGYGNVLSAIRHVERCHGIVWRWDATSKLYRCLTSSQAVVDAQQSLKRSGKFAKKALLTNSTVRIEELSTEELAQYRATSIQAELSKLSATGDIHKRLLPLKEVKPVDANKLMSLFV